MVTCRPEFAPPWGLRSYLTPLVLTRFSPPQIEAMVSGVTGAKPLPAEVIQHLVDKTDGVPLYVEELLRAILEAGLLQDSHGRYALTGPLASLAIPATLQDALMARLDRLETAKGIAQIGAVIGREFIYELLQAVSPQDEVTLQAGLAQLVEAELLYQRGRPPRARYLFKHALIQEAAYQSLLKSARQQYHRRIAQALVEQFPETVASQPELIAHHYTESDLGDQAVMFWLRASQRARERSAVREAAGHAKKGLEVLALLPESHARTQQELQLLLVLGLTQVAVAGYAAAEVEQAYTRAREVCRHLDDPEHVFPVLHALRSFHLVRAELAEALEIGEDLLKIAQSLHDSELLLHAHMLHGHTLLHLGELTRARTHFEAGLHVYAPYDHTPPRDFGGQDPRMFTRAWLANALSILGYPDQAKRWSDASMALAYELEHPFNLMNAFTYRAGFHRRRQEFEDAEAAEERVRAIAAEHGFAQHTAVGTIFRGIRCIQHGQLEAGKALVHRGMTAYRATGAVVRSPMYCVLLAEVFRDARQVDAGLSMIAEEFNHSERTGERWYEAELYRLKGELLLQQAPDNSGEAETCFHHALDVARAQQAKFLELRAATNLARLRQAQGKRQEAYELLAPVYGWFTEGFETADLQDANALLEELRP
jgi:predicted ATPase